MDDASAPGRIEWGERIRRERERRGWSQGEAIAELRRIARVQHKTELPEPESVEWGTAAITTDRQSLPSLLMVTRDLTSAIQQAAPDAPQVADYLERVRELGGNAA